MPWTPEDIRRSRAAIVEAIRDAGGEVLANGNCRCPFHDDQNPSASIKLLDKGHWHYHCFPCGWGGDVFAVIQRHRGCTFPQARDIAQGLVGGLAPEPPKPTRQVRAFPLAEAAAAGYAAFKGGTVERLYRWSPTWTRARIRLPKGKTFLEITRTDAGWTQKAPAKPHCLYRTKCPDQPNIPATGPIAVCEGEKATDAAWSIGIPAVTSGGSSSAAYADWAPLAGRMVAILPDMDEPGTKYAVQVAELLRKLSPPARVKIVRLPGLGEGEDIYEFIERWREGT